MPLALYYHPFSSFCQKVLIALYENDTPFEPHFVDLGDEASAKNFRDIWPIGKFPVLRDEARALTIPELTIIIEFLSLYHPGKTLLIPTDADLALQTRMRDRFFDLHIHLPMQKVVGDRLRPPGQNDPFGVEQAKAQMRTALGMVEAEIAAKTWAMGDVFSMADCAAAPALYYANLVMPFGDTHRNVAAYLDRLMARPSFARVIKEAEPYRKLFPL